MLRIMREITKILYNLPGTGLPRIAKIIRKYYANRFPNKEIIIDDFMGGLRFSCRLGEHMGSKIFWKGAYSESQLRLLKKLLKPGSFFIDLGANQGEFTVLAAHLVGEKGHVFAFEPNPAVRERLIKNVQLNNFTQVTVEPYAVGEEEKTMLLYSNEVIDKDGTENIGLSTIFLREGFSAVTDVQVIALDQWKSRNNIKKVDLIKIDVEGAELPALRGGVKLISECRPIIILELNEETCRFAGYSMIELIDWIKTQGYELYIIDEDSSLNPIDYKNLDSFQNICAIPNA